MASVKNRRINILLAGAAALALFGCDDGKELMAASHEGHEHAQKAESAAVYHCPMHPTYTSDRPGSCPICGMDFVLVKEQMPMEGGTKGQAAVAIDAAGRQLIGVKIEPVQIRQLSRIIRISGRIAYDPGLFSAQEEYLAARKSLARIGGSSDPETVRRAESLVSSSRLKLKLLGLSDAQIKRLARRGEPDANLLMAQGGEGAVWLYADIYEHDFGLIKAGQRVEATTLAYPGLKFTGEVAAIDPVVNSKTRTVRLRALISNQEDSLKPDMFMNVSIAVDLGPVLALPASAVMFTGPRRLVYLDKGEGRFEPREVELGMQGGEFYQVISGLEDGDRVVVSGNFLVDSESKLRSAVSGATEHAGHAGH